MKWLCFGLFWAVLAACGPEGAGAKDTASLTSGPNLDVILAERPAKMLSAYGLFVDAGAKQPADGVIGYDLINPLFSDHAEKDRLVYVPKGTKADWRDDDVFAFPVGSVLVKSFSYAETGKIETRLLIHKADGWTGYPYVWNEDRTEAIYSPVGAKKSVQTRFKTGKNANDVFDIAYSVPNQNQCKTCHQAGSVLSPIGPKARNLGAEQVENWAQLGLVSVPHADFASVPSIALEEGDLSARARAYLDINCAHCHKSNGAASNSGLWLTWGEESPVKLGIDKHPTAAGRGAGQLTRVIVPGSADTSILAYRMASVQAGVAMPELGRTLTDEKGVNLVRAWIDEMAND